MSKTNHTIEINAEIKASLSGMDKVKNKLQETLKSKNLSLDSTSQLSKLIREYDGAREELESIIGKGFVSKDETKKMRQLATKVTGLYDNSGCKFSRNQNIS